MLQRNSIRKLEKDVADKIAAGEVVTRPLSIIKELVENAIDAEAGSITVEIKDGGKSYIRVTDDGSGIPAEELPLAFERHATSKIRRAEDLSHIVSLGFRGEALASIAAVTRVEVITKTADAETGARIRIEGGAVTEQGKTGCPEGTTIIVKDLFYNTPARQKFLKPSGTESSLVIDFMSKLALAYPKVRIRLINNGSILFSTSGKGGILDNVLTVYSREIGDPLLKALEKGEDYEIEAYISPPDKSRTNRKHQVFFVNGRAVKSKILEEALTRAYRERLEKDRQPVAFLFLKANPLRLDVNIHPNKMEVRFDNSEEVMNFVTETIQKALSAKEAVPEIRRENVFKRNASADFAGVSQQDRETERVNPKEREEGQVDIIKLLSKMRVEQQQEKNPASRVSYPASDAAAALSPWAVKETAFPDAEDSHPNNAEEASPGQMEDSSQWQVGGFAQSSMKVSGGDSLWENLRVTGAIFNTYITAVDEMYFYLFDQHAAHERIFYEKLLKGYESAEKNTQILMTPMIHEMIPSIASRFAELSASLESMGFDLSEFGARSYIVKGIPAFMSIPEAEAFLESFLDQADTIKRPEDRATLSKIIMQACKSAIKAKQRLSEQEREQLIRDLAAAKQPFSCPHGRPTFIKLSKYEIEKMFRRV